MPKQTEPLLKELSGPGRVGHSLPETGVPPANPADILPPSELRSNPPPLPELTEPEVVRHFTRLSQLNYSIDQGFYPLGSCTMKHNPRLNERTAALRGFSSLHPHTPDIAAQGALRLMHELELCLSRITGFPAVSLQPLAGAQGELLAMLIARAHFQAQGQKRNVVLIPDSAHGTNPASATIAGFRCVEVKSAPDGGVDLNAVRAALSDDVACMMLTNPNTLGRFETHIRETAEALHDSGALLYMDGANMNALMGYVLPAQTGVDMLHINLHKTFATPHGGGGPGSGPLCVTAELEKFLPAPRIVKEGDRFCRDYDRPESVGKVHGFFGNFGVVVRALTYIRTMGAEGLKGVTEQAVLNANYLKSLLEEEYDLPYKGPCMHEFVLSGRLLKKFGVTTLDVAKALLDRGEHAPTVYFPLIVEDALMIEPTETETKETLERFAAALLGILEEAKSRPDGLHEAPVTTPVRRLDEVKAAKELKVTWQA